MTASPRVLKHHVEAALAALKGGPYPTLDAAARAVATAVIEAEGNPKWVVITDTGTRPTVYGPYGSAETARNSWNSGLMLGSRMMLFAMQPVPRRGKRHNHTLEQNEQGETE